MKLETTNKTNQFLSKWLLYALFIGLPLVMNNGYFNISETKSLYFLSLSVLYCVITLIVSLLCIIKKKKIDIKICAIDIFLISFCIINVISSVLSKYGLEVWIGRDSRLQGSLIILLYVSMYLMLSNFIGESVRNSKLIPTFAITFLIVAVVAIMHSLNVSITDLFKDFDESKRGLFISTIGNINFFSSFICLSLPVFVVFFINSKNKDEYVAWLIVLIFVGVGAVLSSSDSFVVGFLAFLAVAPFFFYKTPKSFIRFCVGVMVILLSSATFYYLYKLFPKQIYETASFMKLLLSPAVLGCLVLILLLACVLAHTLPKLLRLFPYIYLTVIIVAAIGLISAMIYANNVKAVGILKKFVFNNSWGNGRGRIYKICFETIKKFSLKEWLFGIGPESLQYHLISQGITKIDQAHSEYLQILISTGVFGLLSYFGVIVSTICVVVRKLRFNHIAVAFFLGLVAYWSQATVSIAQTFTTPFVYLFLAIIGYEYKNFVNLSSKEKSK